MFWLNKFVDSDIFTVLYERTRIFACGAAAAPPRNFLRLRRAQVVFPISALTALLIWSISPHPQQNDQNKYRVLMNNNIIIRLYEEFLHTHSVPRVSVWWVDGSGWQCECDTDTDHADPAVACIQTTQIRLTARRESTCATAPRVTPRPPPAWLSPPPAPRGHGWPRSVPCAASAGA